jgi:RND family efflux transporter MFP subunit
MVQHDLSRLKISDEQKTPKTKSRRRWGRWTILSVVIALVIGYFSWTQLLYPSREARIAKVSPSFAARALTILNASGYVVAQRKAAVSSKATGRLAELYIEEGKRVSEGELLASLENDDLRATLEETRAALLVAQALLKNAEAEFEDATLNYNRQKGLRESGSVSVQSFDTAEARYKKAVASERSVRYGVDRSKANIRVAEVNLEYSYIRAPFDGVILTKSADIGEVVAPFGSATNAKAAVATMADMTSLQVEVDVAESSIEKVTIGQACEIKLDAFPNERFDGAVHMIVPTADRSKATVMAKVKFNKLDPRVLPEMSAKVAFLSRPLKEDEKQSFLGIPASAIKKNAGADVVLRVENGRAREVKVKIGRKWNDTHEVVSGLNENDIVVVGPENIKAGDRVNIKE